MNTIFLNVMTAGLVRTTHNEYTSIAIIDNDGNTLLDTKSKPVEYSSWSTGLVSYKANREAVENAPTNEELKEKITSICAGKEVIIFNTSPCLRCIPYIKEVALSIVDCSSFFYYDATLAKACKFFKLKNSNPLTALASTNATREIFQCILSVKDEFTILSESFKSMKPLRIIQTIYVKNLDKTYKVQYEAEDEEFYYIEGDCIDEESKDMLNLLDHIDYHERVTHKLYPLLNFIQKNNPNEDERVHDDAFILSEERHEVVPSVKVVKVKNNATDKEFIAEYRYNATLRCCSKRVDNFTSNTRREDYRAKGKIEFFLDTKREENMLKGLIGK